MRRRCSEELGRRQVQGQAPRVPISLLAIPISLLCSALIALVIILSTLSTRHYPLELWRGELHTGSLPAAITQAPKPGKRTSLILSRFSFTFIQEFHQPFRPWCLLRAHICLVIPNKPRDTQPILPFPSKKFLINILLNYGWNGKYFITILGLSTRSFSCLNTEQKYLLAMAASLFYTWMLLLKYSPFLIV